MAYKLELPEDACIHPVFHASFLKAKLRETITLLSRLLPVDALEHLAPQPTKILETRTIKKKRLPAVTEMLVQWEGGPRWCHLGAFVQARLPTSLPPIRGFAYPSL